MELSSRMLDSYASIVGEEEIHEIRLIAKFLKGATIQHINSTAVGGGVAELLTTIIPLMRDVGIEAFWDILPGNSDFFAVTKAFHNNLHGGYEPVSPQMFRTFLDTTERGLHILRKGMSFYAMHDPQPIALIRERSTQSNWLWRCHIDLSDADIKVWSFLRPFVERYDAAIFHLADYAKDLSIPQNIVPPAIDPLTEKNIGLDENEVNQVLTKYNVDPAIPIILQVSRFDRLKDPIGVIKAWQLARRSHPCQLVLAGGGAKDDPEGERVLSEVREVADKDPDIHILALPPTAHREINALQRAAAVVVQKSLREGFGLVVTEAMWKSKPVIGGAVGGIRRQIIHGSTGFLVHTIEGTAFRIRQLLGNPSLAKQLGENARKYVIENFLPTTYLKRWLLILLSLREGRESVIHLS